MDVHQVFDRSIAQQIALNRARTPDERFAALCDLLDAARDLAPREAEGHQRRRRAIEARQFEREQWRERCRRISASQRAGARPRV